MEQLRLILNKKKKNEPVVRVLEGLAKQANEKRKLLGMQLGRYGDKDLEKLVSIVRRV